MSASSETLDNVLSSAARLKALPRSGTNSFGHFLTEMDKSSCKHLMFSISTNGNTASLEDQRTTFKLSGLVYLPDCSWYIFTFDRSWLMLANVYFSPDKILSRLMSLGFHVTSGEWSDTSARFYLKSTMWMDDSIMEYNSVADAQS